MPTDPIDREFVYKIRPIKLLLTVLACAGIALFMAYKGWTNNRALTIEGFIRLPPEQATGWYWALSGVLTFISILGCILVIRNTFSSQRIALTRSSILVPASRLTSGEVEIPYTTIIAVSPLTVDEQRVLKIRYKSGEFALFASMLPSSQDFDWICGQIDKRMEEAKRSRGAGGANPN